MLGHPYCSGCDLRWIRLLKRQLLVGRVRKITGPKGPMRSGPFLFFAAGVVEVVFLPLLGCGAVHLLQGAPLRLILASCHVYMETVDQAGVVLRSRWR